MTSPASENEKGSVHHEESRAVMKDGVPHYLGLTGDRLIMAITVVSTMGFALFGYDQGIVSRLFGFARFSHG